MVFRVRVSAIACPRALVSVAVLFPTRQKRICQLKHTENVFGTGVKFRQLTLTKSAVAQGLKSEHISNADRIKIPTDHKEFHY